MDETRAITVRTPEAVTTVAELNDAPVVGLLASRSPRDHAGGLPA